MDYDARTCLWQKVIKRRLLRTFFSALTIDEGGLLSFFIRFYFLSRTLFAPFYDGSGFLISLSSSSVLPFFMGSV
jgi:hypothetical protein